MTLPIGRRVEIRRDDHPWNGACGIVQEEAGPETYVVSVIPRTFMRIVSDGMEGRYVFHERNLVLLCDGKIPGHN